MKTIKTKDFKLSEREKAEFEFIQKTTDRHYFFQCLGCNKQFNNLGNDSIQTQYCSLVCKMENFDNNEKLLKEKPKEFSKKLSIKKLNEKFWNLKS